MGKEFRMDFMNKLRFGKFLLLGIALVFAGCGGASPLSSPEGELGRPVVIEAGAVDLTFGAEQLARGMARVPVRSRAQMTTEGRNELFEALVLQELVFAEGVRAGLAQDPEIQDQLAGYLRQLVQNRVMADLALTVEVSPEEVADYYQEKRSKFATRKIRARHILLQDRATAEKVHQEALQDPAAFPALAKRYSMDKSSASNGGDLGFFGYGKMAPEFEEAAFALEEPLEISAIVEVPSGFHIIQATDFRPGRERLLTEVQAKIRALLLRRAIDARKAEFFQGLKDSYTASMDPEAMNRALGMVKVTKEKSSAH